MPTTRTKKSVSTPSRSNNQRWYWVGGTVAILLFFAAGWLVWANMEDPKVTEVKALQQELFSDANLDDAARRERFGQLREKMDGLTEEQRDAIRGSMFEGFRQRENARMAEYFALPADQRVAYLDAEIKQMEDRRKQWAARRNSGDDRGPPGGGRGGFGGRGGQGGGPGGGGRGGPGQDPQERKDRQRNRLDNSTPTERAQRTAYFEDMAKRREELGLPPMQWGRPGGRG